MVMVVSRREIVGEREAHGRKRMAHASKGMHIFAAQSIPAHGADWSDVCVCGADMHVAVVLAQGPRRVELRRGHWAGMHHHRRPDTDSVRQCTCRDRLQGVVHLPRSHKVAHQHLTLVVAMLWKYIMSRVYVLSSVRASHVTPLEAFGGHTPAVFLLLQVGF